MVRGGRCEVVGKSWEVVKRMGKAEGIGGFTGEHEWL